MSTQAVKTSKQAMELEEEFGAHNYHPMPVVISRGKGVHVWDPEGKRYYDFLSAYSAINQGHCHPKIIKALEEQAQKLTLCSRAFYSDQLGSFEKYITEYFGYEMMLPMNTGAEAVETGIKLARKWGYVKKGIPEDEAIILAPSGNFHGRTIGMISMSTDPSSRDGFGPFLANVGPSCLDLESPIRYGHAEDLEKVLEAHGDKVAAFLVEPIQGEAGIMVPPPDYLSRCKKVCERHNVLLIADEIQTGIARTGTLLASEQFGVHPDLVLLGKALSGGVYPVSCVLGPRDVMLCIRPGEHGSTYGGNPLACAVSRAALDVIHDEHLVENARELGEQFRQGICDIHSPMIREVRGRGLLNAIELDESYCHGKSAWDLCLLLRDHGLLAKPTHDTIIRFAPPLVITKEQLAECIQIIHDAFDEFSKK